MSWLLILIPNLYVVIPDRYFCWCFININPYCYILFADFSGLAFSKAWVWDRSLAVFVVSNLPGCMDVCCNCSVLSGRGLCVGLITRSEDSYRVWCVWVRSWNFDNEEALAHWGRLHNGGKYIQFILGSLNSEFTCYVQGPLKVNHPYFNIRFTNRFSVFLGGTLYLISCH